MAHIRSTKKLLDYFKKRDLLYKMNEEEDGRSVASLNVETEQPEDELDKRKNYDKTSYYNKDERELENYSNQSTTITTQHVYDSCNQR